MYSNTTKKNHRYAKNTTLRGSSIESPRTLKDLRNSIDRAIEEYSGGGGVVESGSDSILQATDYEEIPEKKYKGGGDEMEITPVKNDVLVHEKITEAIYKHTIILTQDTSGNIKLDYTYIEDSSYNITNNTITYDVSLNDFYITSTNTTQMINNDKVNRYTVALKETATATATATDIDIEPIVQAVAIVVSVCYIDISNNQSANNTIQKWLTDTNIKAKNDFAKFATSVNSKITITFGMNKDGAGQIKVYDPIYIYHPITNTP